MLVICTMVLGAALTGCAKKADSPEQAIEKAKSMKSVEEQANYLTQQAELFFKSEQYKEAVQLSQHVLTQVDAESKKAQEILDDAKEQLGSAVKNAVDDMKKSIGNFGKK